MDAHAYTLVGAKTIILADCSEERLLKIRNPYGMKEWSGDWSDKSKKWTVRTRDQVNGEDKEDGVFFINLRDFMKFFTRTTICYYQTPHFDNFEADQHEIGSWAMTKFTLERDNPQPLTVTIDSISERFMGEDYVAPATKVILTKLTSKVNPDPEVDEVTTVQTFIGGDRIFDSHASVSFLEGLSKGVYVALYQTEFTDSDPERKLIFSVYCGQPTTL